MVTPGPGNDPADMTHQHGVERDERGEPRAAFSVV
jgi:hypothetical protein